jgi:hypothetical protein
MRSNHIRIVAILFIVGALIQTGVSFFLGNDPEIKPVPVEINFDAPQQDTLGDLDSLVTSK